MSIKIVKPLRSVEVKNFETVDEFNLYYENHKAEIDQMTTCAINKSFKIPGMHLTKIKGELKAKAVCQPEEDPKDQIIENLQKDIKAIKLTMKNIIAEVNNLKQFINQE